MNESEEKKKKNEDQNKKRFQQESEALVKGSERLTDKNKTKSADKGEREDIRK